MATLRLGDTAPNFVQESSIGNIDFYTWLGSSWGILFSHPADYTPVCTTELGATAKLADEFKKRNIKAIALSVDSVDSHLGWIKDINETQSTIVQSTSAFVHILALLDVTKIMSSLDIVVVM